MGTFFVYILKAAVCLAIFYLFYKLLMSRETFHRFNRITLLLILAISLVIPFIHISTAEPVQISQPVITVENYIQSVNSQSVVSTETKAPFPWLSLLLAVYILGIVVIAVRDLYSIFSLLKLIHQGSHRQLDDVTLVVLPKSIASFSWMKYIFISEKDLAESGEQILTHELEHIHLHHSFDLLVAELCILLQWFNPAVWLLKRELQNIHEFEADEAVIRHGVNAREYQLLLIKKAVGSRLYSLANSLNHSSLKIRIAMMIKSKSNPWSRMKVVYILPLAAITVVAFARPEISQKLQNISDAKVNELTSVVKEKVAESVVTPVKTIAKPVKPVPVVPNKNIIILGTVVDKNDGSPIPGTNVIIKGTTKGTITDANGKFMLGVDQKGTLCFSFIGYRTEEVQFDANDTREPFTIKLTPEVLMLDKVLVVGYGKKETSEEKKQTKEVFMVVEALPSFPGGKEACAKFLASNIKYPAIAQENGIQGSVTCSFVVSPDGSIINAKVIRGVDPSLDKEALRVVGLMPKWNPGEQRGKPVPVEVNLPIEFHLQ